MAEKFDPYYFTEKDPDYRIKGSRDPLGLQVIWQHQAKDLIPYLSTVSAYLRDFQILCLAYYFYGRKPDNNFYKYFQRFEQLMAYTRYKFDRNASFNGIEMVRRTVINSSKISISNNPKDELLSNQRAYGIWGKYNRPFSDIKFIYDNSFQQIFDRKLELIKERAEIERIIKKVRDDVQLRCELSDLEPISELFKLNSQEKSFYQRKILQVETAPTYQNVLFEYVASIPESDAFNLYSFINGFRRSTFCKDDSLKQILSNIENTEKIISPLNRIFRYIQKRPSWNKDEIENDSFITKSKQAVNFTFASNTEEGKLKNLMSQNLTKDNWELIKYLVRRNTEVTTWRGGAPWISINDNLVEVNYSEGGAIDQKYNPKKDSDNGYFIDIYLELYYQINS